MHVHTVNSGDSKIRIEDIHQKINEGIVDCVVVTEHNLFENEGRYPIFYGEEIKTTKGDIIAMGISEQIQPYLSPEETLDLIHEQGGIGIAPHPFYPFLKKGLDELVKKLPIDAIEVFNSRNTKKADRKALELALARNLPATAGSDAHRKSEIGNAYVIVDYNVQSIDDLIKLIKKGKTAPVIKKRSGIYSISRFL